MSENDSKRDEREPAKRKRGRPRKSAQPRGAETVQPVAAEAKPAKAKPARYVIAKGKALTTCAGMLSEGDEIKPDHVPGGAARLAELAESGFIEAK